MARYPVYIYIGTPWGRGGALHLYVLLPETLCGKFIAKLSATFEKSRNTGKRQRGVDHKKRKTATNNAKHLQ